MRVLISTYWNVNERVSLDALNGNCFNLNLLECKLRASYKSSLLSKCFNLNLLECKYSFDVEPFSSAVVLISTYWNVNVYWDVVEYWEFNSFNLNLLECKSIFLFISFVLTSSFNLNLLECKSWTCIYVLFEIQVLISTYWNVNQERLLFRLLLKWF